MKRIAEKFEDEIRKREVLKKSVFEHEFDMETKANFTSRDDEITKLKGELSKKNVLIAMCLLIR